jgi:hypothetical protein
MKNILLLSGLMIQSLVVFAQQPISGNAKITSIGQRVIGESHYSSYGSSTLFLSDTLRYKYSGSNGSTFYYGSDHYLYQYFDKFFTYEKDADLPYNDVSADSITHWQAYSSSSPLTLSNYYYGQYAQQGVLSFITITFATPQVYKNRDLNIYNAQNQFIEHIGQIYDTSAGWVDFNKFKFGYNANNKLTTDSSFIWNNSTQAWDFSGTEVRTYDPQNRLISIESFDAASNSLIYKYAYTYYQDNKLRTRTIWNTNAGGPIVPNVVDSFGYTMGVDFPTSRYSYGFLGGDVGVTITKLNAQMLPDSVFSYSFNTVSSTFALQSTTTWQYTNKLPKQWIEYNNAANQQSRAHYFYYENYITTTIANTAKPASIKLYPNPTSNNLNLEWQEGIGKQATISITNTAGQLLRSESFTWMQPKEAISLKALASGNYFIRVADAQGNVVFASQFIKE